MKQLLIAGIAILIGVVALTGYVNAQTVTTTVSPVPSVTTTVTPLPSQSPSPSPTGSVQGATTVTVPNAAPATGHAQ